MSWPHYFVCHMSDVVGGRIHRNIPKEPSYGTFAYISHKLGHLYSVIQVKIVRVDLVCVRSGSEEWDSPLSLLGGGFNFFYFHPYLGK